MLPISLLSLIALPFVAAAPTCRIRPTTSSATVTPTPSPTSTGSSTLPGKATNGSNDDVVVTAWYAGYHAEYFPPENVSWTKYSSMTYGFATTTTSSPYVEVASSDQAILPRFVSAAHQNGVDALLTVGGWGGSLFYSTAVSSNSTTSDFIQGLLALVKQYDLDGLDFDWEYPAKQGIGCNAISDTDSANFLSFLQQLRAQPEAKNLTLSAAVSITPWVGSDGQPLTDVSQYAQVLDYIEIMNYDIWGNWSTAVGPNSPLNDTCAPTADQQGSAVSAVKAWTTAGFPANQIVLGVAAYGHSFDVSAANANESFPPFNAALQPAGDAWAQPATGSDVCGAPYTQPGGTYEFFGMIENGFLTANGTAAPGIDYRFDECSQTPYVYNSTSNVMISYDDARSFAAKGAYINQAGLRGFAMFEAAGDSNDILLDAISNAIGIEDNNDTC
ncbi:glycoside hydrolase family 18 protein [Serpula lacrymans var. lacrymans S7.3]|uniref:Glycoside hydrolase family 18 protein n=2 Tax=Serpula lacrymans var. lacrymans TaxID=341189 RepID=F8PJP9_SERL3|nr:glycoside hydrolase family 18 protein [Serpula lacrymans var. lacrymans S7.9]EGO03459.1 glycoside hydrolase family 18 protein [Serpula lacrymans var. lacrymans S7.3]EGO29218.1 glycoside hydrolase family 18 protein [Serpula lacrymans var. lacrymans S7.9]